MTNPDSKTASRDGLVVAALGGLVAATVLLGALLPGHPAQGPASAAEPSGDVACLEWSDGCRVCQRLPEGPACSLPGIACTPEVFRCLRRAGG
ncbi:hypothetical protein [Methylobacterium durans]|uniref:Uncharacterized protein n=1 Tax=Methylobacterium durans TaxID=2202825 RepID=A0A2U8W7I0_9HYPH|nr:hypothetical protein [Methylobacterium durans]AWN41266.1 hypothetical protein DK389_12970 [Methylobacterium durans]